MELDNKVQITILFDYEIHADGIYSTGMIKLNVFSEINFAVINEIIKAKLKQKYNSEPDVVKLTALSANIKDVVKMLT